MRIDIVRDALMKNYTTFRIGGPADLLIQPSSEEELIRIAAYLRQKDISAVVLGNGSNVLVKDGGIRGVVLKSEKIWEYPHRRRRDYGGSGGASVGGGFGRPPTEV